MLEARPALTSLGDTSEEATQMLRAHEDVITKIQSKQSPTEELLRKADFLIASQRPQPEVYTAMAESLGQAWEDVLKHLMRRRDVLNLNVSYQSRAKIYFERVRALELLCCGSPIPKNVESIRENLEHLQEVHRAMLESLMSTLQEGGVLLDSLRSIANEKADSRPDGTRSSTLLAISQVEHWIEQLHDQRKMIERIWSKRRTLLEQGLALSLLATDLTLLESLLFDRQESLSQSTNHLGNSEAETKSLLGNHRTLMPEAKELQEQSLKVLRAGEQLFMGGHLTDPESSKRGYSILQCSAEYIQQLVDREDLLIQSIQFYQLANQVFTELDKLQIEVDDQRRIDSSVIERLNAATNTIIEQGHAILKAAPGAEGIKKVLETIENRKMNLSMLYQEEHIKISEILNNFLEKQNELYSWLINDPDAFIKGNKDVGYNDIVAKSQLTTHLQLLEEMQNKGCEINSLLMGLPHDFLERLSGEEKIDVTNKIEELHKLWVHLKNVLEQRVTFISAFIKVYSKIQTVSSEFDSLEGDIKVDDVMSDNDYRTLREYWSTTENHFQELLIEEKRFLQNADVARDVHLDVDHAQLCIVTLVKQLTNRETRLGNVFSSIEARILEHKKEIGDLWQRNMADSNKTMDWVSKLDGQLYPVLNEEITSSNAVVTEIENKLNIILPEVKRAQTEIEARIQTAEALVGKGEAQDAVPPSLRELNEKLLSIISDYQNLADMLIKFFKNLSQVEATVSQSESNYNTENVENNLNSVDLSLDDHESLRQSISEYFRQSHSESVQVINKIKQQEPESAGERDIACIRRLLESKRGSWERNWAEYKVKLEQKQQLCQFDTDLANINHHLDDLSKQLVTIRGQYGESLSSAKSTSLAFLYFEKTVQLLEQRIETFITAAEAMLSSDECNSAHINSELAKLKKSREAFLGEVTRSRQLIDLSIQYFQLVEEAQEWFREGSKLLILIARKSSEVESPEEINQLLEQIELFLKPAEVRQEERIDKITQLAIKIFGDEKLSSVQEMASESQELVESLQSVCKELEVLGDTIKNQNEEIHMETDEFAPKPEIDTIADEPSGPIIEEIVEKKEEEPQVEEMPSDTSAQVEEMPSVISTQVEEMSSVTSTQVEEMPSVTPTPVEEMPSETPTQVEEMPTEAISEGKDSGDKDRRSPSPPPPLKKAKFTEEEEIQPPSLEPPVFIEPLVPCTVQEGEKFILECKISGNPTPKITWLKDNLSIENNPDYLTKFEDGICTLTIEETFAEDSAQFTCVATNEAGSVSTSAVLSVTECPSDEHIAAPEFVKSLQSSSIPEGSELELSCQVEGNPLPTVQWFKNEVCIDNCSDYVISYNNGEAFLKLEKITGNDEGKYSCKAVNPTGSSYSHAFVTVEKKKNDEVTGSAPKFTNPLSNVMARAGQKIKLECEVEGDPRPDLTWTHNDKIINENRDVQFFYDDKKAGLIINEAFPNDAGVYKLTAKNSIGEVTSSCSAAVKGIPPLETSDSELASDSELVKPVIKMPLKDLSIVEGEKAQLDCIIVAHPEPEVIWYFEGKPVKESTDLQLIFAGDRCTLVINHACPDDSGEYEVVAINSAGENTSSCTLTVECPEIKPAEEVSAPAVSEIIEIKETILPKFNKLLDDILSREGDTVTLEVSIFGQPAPTVKWFLNNTEIAPSNRIQILDDGEGNHKLQILEVKPEDKGVYTVKANNSLGEVKCFSHLIVKENTSLDAKPSTEVQLEEKLLAPHFVERFSDRSAPVSTSVKFECIVTGKPTPKVKWFFNYQPVSGSNFLVSTSGDRRVLTIPDVTQESEGIISCIAENEVGKTSCDARLAVEDIGRRLELFPAPKQHVEESSKSYSYEMKQSSFMESSSIDGCAPTKRIQSFKTLNENAMQQSGNQPPLQMESSETEEYKNIDGKESHIQSLKSSSNFGGILEKHESLTSSNANLPHSNSLTFPKPIRKQTAPRFISTLMGKIVDEGANVVLEGIIEGFPAPAISWSKNGVDVYPIPGKLTINWSLNKASLEISDVTFQDGGRYTCKADNTLGSATCTADIVVKKNVFSPIIGRRLQSQTVPTNERVVLEVEVTGQPEPAVTWLKDNQEIPKSSGMYRFRSQGNSHALIIDKVSFAHGGQYTVRMKNEAGESSSSASVYVFEPPPPASAPKETLIDTKFTGDWSVPDSGISSSNWRPSVNSEHSKAISEQFNEESKSSGARSETVYVSETIQRDKQVIIKLGNDIPTSVPSLISPTKLPIEPSSKTNVTHTFTEHRIPDERPVYETSSTNTQEETSVEDHSITKRSALDFFKNIIKENEEGTTQEKTFESNKMSSSFTESGKEPSFVKEPVSKPSTFSSSMPVLTSLPSPFVKNTFESFSESSSSFSKQTKTIEPFPHAEIRLEPGPPPEMGYIPKVAAPRPKPDMLSRVRRIEESQRELSPIEIPSGGVKIFPTISRKNSSELQQKFSERIQQQPVQTMAPPTPQTSFAPPTQQTSFAPPTQQTSFAPPTQQTSFAPPTQQTNFAPKSFITESERREVIEDTIIKKKVEFAGSQDSTFVRQIQPTSFISVPHAQDIQQRVNDHAPILRPQADNISLRPSSPRPSAEGISMEKLWSSKHKEESSTFIGETVKRAPSPSIPYSKPKSPTPAFSAPQAFKPSTPAPSYPVTQPFKPFTPTPSYPVSQPFKPSTPAPSYPVTQPFKPSTPAPSFPVTQPQRAASPPPAFLSPQYQRSSSPLPSFLSSQSQMSASWYGSETKRAASPRPSAEGVAMEKLWSRPHSVAAPLKPTSPVFPKTAPVYESKSKVQTKPLKKTWPPPKAPEEEVNTPWTSRIVEQSSTSEAIPGGYRQESKSFLSEQSKSSSKQPLQSLRSKSVTPAFSSSVEKQEMMSFSSYSSSSMTQSSSQSMTQSAFQPSTQNMSQSMTQAAFQPSIIQNTSQSMTQSAFQPSIVQNTSQLMTQSAFQPSLTQTSQSMTQSAFQPFQSSLSPPIVEEKILKPSEVKKVWPPGNKTVEPAFVPKKFTPKPSKPYQPPPPQNIPDEDFHLEPGPPPEMAYAEPPPTTLRRQSYVETIEENLEKDIERGPRKCLLGAVRTIPPQPSSQKETESHKENISSNYNSSSSYSYESKNINRQSESEKTVAPPWIAHAKRPLSVEIPPNQFSYSATSRQLRPVSCHMESYMESYAEQQFKSSSGTTLRPASPPEYCNTYSNQSAKTENYKQKKQNFQPDSGYMADTDEPRHLLKQSNYSESRDWQQRKYATLPASTKALNKKGAAPIKPPTEKSVKLQDLNLEPFPYSPEPVKPVRKQAVPPPISPSKFIKGEYHENEHESANFETARIPPIWKPHDSDSEDLSYRPVRPNLTPVSRRKQYENNVPPPFKPNEQPPQPTTPVKLNEILSPTKMQPKPFLQSPPAQPKSNTLLMVKPSSISKTNQQAPPPNYVACAKLAPAVETSNTVSFSESTETSKRIVNLEKTTKVYNYENMYSSESQSQSSGNYSQYQNSTLPGQLDVNNYKAEQKRLERVEQMRKRFESSNDIILQPGEPPEFVLAGPQTTQSSVSHEVSSQMNGLNDRFKSKVQKFSSDVTTDLNKRGIESRSLQAKTENSPSYREESRHSEYGSTWGESRVNAQYSPGGPPINAGANRDLVQRPPFFTTPLRDIAVVKGHSARFECIVQGEPTPQIIWSKDSSVIEDSDQYEIQFRNGVCRLTLPQAYSYDAGLYRCSASNTSGSTDTTATLTVSGENRRSHI